MSNFDIQENREQLKHQIDVIEKHLDKNPDDYTVLFALALRHYHLDEFNKTTDICYKLSKLGAEQIEVYSVGGRAAMKAGRYKAAIEMAKIGLGFHPDNYELLIQLAMSYNKDKQIDEADKIFEKIQQQKPDDAVSYITRGNYLVSIGKIDEALSFLQEGLEKFPDSLMILNNIGSIYTKLDEHLLASEYYLKALRIQPDHADCLVNLGSAFERMKKIDMAQKFYDQALVLEPKNPIALCCKANTMCNHGLAQEAMPIYREGLKLLKEMPEVQNAVFMVHSSNHVFFQHYLPDFPREKILESILEWQKDLCSDCIEKPATDFENDPNKTRKLKVGLISKGFCVHPVGQMIYAALENLDKDKFELCVYSELGPDKKDYLTEKFLELIPNTISVANEVNHILVNKIRDDQIDILIEMTGHSEGGRRLQLIAERAAPVQVKWVGGLFNTTGVPQMDWMITDNIETPEGVDDWYTEKLYRMPDDYIVYYPPYYAPDVKDLPAKQNGYVTFGNLNNLTKTNSYSVELWSKILKQVPNSKLLLKGTKMDEPFVLEHLYNAFSKYDIGKDRVLIEGGEKHPEFLNVYNRIDIALDPHPYTGGLTTCEALWMGVPVITLPGDTFAGRHAASHLTNAGFPEFIAETEQNYIDIAAKWANNLDELAELRARLRDDVSKTPLVDGPRFAKNLENAFYHMWGEWCDDKMSANAPKEISKPKPKKSKKRK